MKLNLWLKRVAIAATLSTVPFLALGEENYHIGVSVPSADHGWTAGLLWWANKAADELNDKYPNVEFTVLAANSGTAQVGDVEDLMVRRIDALVILPTNPATLQQVIAEAYHEGIYTVVVDRELDTPTQDVFLAGDNPGMGEQAAIYMADALDEKGKVVIIEGPSIPINAQRVNAFRDELSRHSGMEILDSQSGEWNPQTSLNVMEDMLARYPHIDGVWAGDDDALKGVYQAIRESGRTDIKVLVGGGGSKDVIGMIRQGDSIVSGTVTYPPNMIASGMAVALTGLMGQHLGDMYHGVPSRLILAADLITEENADEFYEPDAAY
ncbi:substrate-binding domain-containing protein [Saccharospirillum mangrovi]|uniref:substrate-binding domain-containing protein n=1 Tax=Saccharospirillum mangrovi TaxID=2161747 RepID=UPI000D39648C|nr:substrate-binding domain-containing protein [Saccharospirillum mangrovi]